MPCNAVASGRDAPRRAPPCCLRAGLAHQHGKEEENKKERKGRGKCLPLSLLPQGAWWLECVVVVVEEEEKEEEVAGN